MGDLREMRPSEVVRLLNSSPLGTVLNATQLGRNRDQAGFRIGDGKTVDFSRYLAWLAGERRRRRDDGEAQDYEAHRVSAARRSRDKSRAGRDIGPIPDVVNPARKEACREDYKRFAETYFPATFYLGWSEDHLEVITTVQIVTLSGGMYGIGMPRGSGKTTLCEVAIIWAVCYGHHEFAMLISQNQPKAQESLDKIKRAFESNDLLLEDFPEVCFPIRCLDGIPHRAGGQLCMGKRTFIQWGSDQIVLPTIDGSVASGGVVQTAGITGAVRGAKFARADGREVRPSLVLVDDPQTRESAKSPSQCDEREKILNGDVLGLAGPGRALSVLATVTVVYDGDLAHRLLDRERSPEWRGVKKKFVYAWPEREDLWARYGEIRRESLINGLGAAPATQFYEENRSEMDRGAKVAWEARFDPGEISALQHAWNKRYSMKGQFWAEFQNEPEDDELLDDRLVAADVCRKLSKLDKGVLPPVSSHVVAFIDLHEHCHFWAVAAVADDFSGSLIDYGTWPKQTERYFTLRKLRRTLAARFPGFELGAFVSQGLSELTDYLASRTFKTPDGSSLHLEFGLIDAGWQTETIRQWAAGNAGARWQLSFGDGVTAKRVPLNELQKKPGDRIGLHWRIPGESRGGVRHVNFDTNYWKTFFKTRLQTPFGAPGCWTLYGDSPREHELIADHFCVETSTPQQGRGRIVNEWSVPVGKKGADQHLFDCGVGCCVAASIRGCVLPGTENASAQPQRKKVSFREQHRRAQKA